MGKEIFVKADLTGCSVVFLVPATDGLLDILSFNAMQALLDRGVDKVSTMTMGEAAEKLVEIQQKYGDIPTEQKFLKVTPKGSIIQLFH